MNKRLLIPLAVVALGGCSSELDELKQFVRESDKGLPRKIEPLPAVKPFEPFTYEGFDLPDPFKPRKLSSAPCAQPPCGGPAPDLNRRKEPLEAFPLEQLKMVGTLSQGPDTYALVRADKTLYRVKKGNYMGQNFGLITDVTESEIKLKEIVQDSAGDWAERQSVLPLLEETGKGDKK
jgi:type IV pilus assembly protein PilP